MTELANVVNVPVPGSPRFQQDTAMALSRIRAALGPEGTPSFSTIALPGLTDNKPIYADADGILTSVTVGTSLSFSAPILDAIQDIRTTSNPEFSGLTIRDNTGAIVLSVTGAEFYYTKQVVGGTAGTPMGLLLLWTYPS